MLHQAKKDTPDRVAGQNRMPHAASELGRAGLLRFGPGARDEVGASGKGRPPQNKPSFQIDTLAATVNWATDL